MKAARAPFLVVSFIPAVLGGLIGYYSGYFDWTIFILATVGIVMAHGAADFIDDYYDFINGNLGNKEQQFHDSPLIRGEVTLKQVMIATLITMGIALAAGIVLLIQVGLPVLYLMLAGTFIVFFYTAPPVRLNYRGLGETMLFFAFGPMIVFGSFYVLSGSFSWAPIFASIPLGIFTMNVGIVSNTFDYEDDIKAGKRCIPVRFGRITAVRIIVLGTVFAYLSVIAGVLLGILPVLTLIVLLTVPLSMAVIRQVRKFDDPGMYTPAMTKAIALTSVSGIILDDGFQYLPLKGRLNLVLVDKNNPFGNGALLPRGILREPIRNIKRASYVFITKSDGEDSEALRTQILEHKPDADIIECSHHPTHLKNLETAEVLDLGVLKEKKIACFSGIAVPESFENFLIELGASIQYRERFIDHHRFSEYELAHLYESIARKQIDFVVTTEKDAARLDPDYIPPVATYYLRLEISILRGADDFEQAINRICFPKKERIRKPILKRKLLDDFVS